MPFYYNPWITTNPRILFQSTGVIGTTAILEALVKRAESGGSYGVDVSTQ